MKNTVGFCQFSDAFRDAGRATSFSYNGLKALYDYLTQIEEDCGMEIELDVIAFDCEYTEYESIEEACAEYFNAPSMEFNEEDGSEAKTVEELEDEQREWLGSRTQLIEFDGGIIISNF